MSMGHTEARAAWIELRKNGTPVTEGPTATLDTYFGIALKQLPPDKWRVGDIVRYVAAEQWAWNKGTMGRITSTRPECDHKGPTEYQVFYVSPLSGSGTWWTTPDDVEFVRR